MELSKYIAEVNRLFQTGNATEHSYRGLLAAYIQGIVGAKFTVINEPSHIECGAPDYVVLRRADSQPIFYAEAKDVGDSDLDGRRKNMHMEQFSRYKGALERIVFTDYLDFHFYEHGQLRDCVHLGDIRGNRIVAGDAAAAEKFTAILSDWASSHASSITSAKGLASIMASKGRLLRHVMLGIFAKISRSCGELTYDDRNLLQLYESFRSTLISDLTHEQFADMYAQTIVYGLFSARLNDSTPEDFSRAEAVTLIPKSNPFLRKIFQDLAGNDLDGRIAWIVDDLVETFAATDVKQVMKDYGGSSKRNDPMVHFYEDFLQCYDPELRKQMGVWYTPKPVVSYIVRSADALLRRDFSMPQGLAYSGRVKPPSGKKGPTHHRLQILDPAAGTGTFLAEAIQLIHDEVCRVNAGIWPDYAVKDLKPRLNGFELMVAPYTIAHIKLEMLLRELGCDTADEHRLRVYLADSLTPASEVGRGLFSIIAAESEAADEVKRSRPVMLVMGNPPYNGESRNKGEWIMGLMNDYKKEPGGRVKLQERNPKWINDDYVKFLRMAESYVERNADGGIVAFINPHGWIDNPTFRGMRWRMLRAFTDIYVLNLHGNAKKGLTLPDGTKDENVFNIMQGVCVNIFVRKGGKKPTDAPALVHYAELRGTREMKFGFLESHDATSTDFQDVTPRAPMYFFTPKDYSGIEEYNQGFSVSELFANNSVCVVTTKDKFLVCDTPQDVRSRISNLISLPDDELRRKYGLRDTRNWTLQQAKNDVGADVDEDKILKYSYRPFDKRYLYYTGTTNGLVARPRGKVQKYLLREENFALLSCRQSVGEWSHVGISDSITDFCCLSNKTKECTYIFPLYIYDSETDERTANFSGKTYAQISKKLGFEPAAEDLFGYVYAVLHSPSYRKRNVEFLKNDFPRIPYISDTAEFRRLSALGRKLIELHLMQGADVWPTSAGFPAAGSNVVERYEYDGAGRVYINDGQYFSGISAEAWNFLMGGYQPLQKWLKDRKGRTLSSADILHYERMVYAIDETIRIMSEIG